MEVVSEDGSKTQIKPGQTREIGRAHGLNASDRTISRRQVSFFIPRVADRREDIRAQFEVLGRNPIYVSTDNEVKIFRRFQRGEMGRADRFCVSAKNPVWYTLSKIENEDGEEGVRRNDSESELAGNLESGFELEGVEDLGREGVDISDVDPVKEFGFVVIGHEFDSYPKKMIRDIRNWDWFLDEPRKDGQYDDEDDDDNEGKRGNNSAKRKRNTGREKDDDDDEEWTGDDNVLINKSRNTRMMPPKYTTRSNDRGKPSRKDEINSTKRSTGKKSRDCMDDDDDEEDDETLGGFIVNDEDEKFDEADEEEDLVDDEDEAEEEEDLVEDEDEDEDEDE